MGINLEGIIQEAERQGFVLARVLYQEFYEEAYTQERNFLELDTPFFIMSEPGFPQPKTLDDQIDDYQDVKDNFLRQMQDK